MDAESSGIGAAAGVVVTALAGMFVKLFGTKSERAAGMAEAAEEWRQLASEARAEREACEERAKETAAEVAELHTRLTAVEVSYAVVVEEHARCPDRITRLESELHALRVSVVEEHGQ